MLKINIKASCGFSYVYFCAPAVRQIAEKKQKKALMCTILMKRGLHLSVQRGILP